MTNTAAELAAKARSEIHNMSVAEVTEALEDGDVTLVDIREPEEIKRTGAIPGAVHAPRGMLEFYADPSSPYHRDVLYNVARLYLLDSNYTKGIDAIKQLVAVDPDNSDNYQLLAIAYASLQKGY